MKEFKYIIKDEMGIHARPAGELVKVAAKYPCEIKIEKDGRSVDAKRIMGIMSFGVKCGMEVVITCEGDQEEEAAVELQAFLEENL